jgi:hypothetical protein
MERDKNLLLLLRLFIPGRVNGRKYPSSLRSDTGGDWRGSFGKWKSRRPGVVRFCFPGNVLVLGCPEPSFHSGADEDEQGNRQTTHSYSLSLNFVLMDE